MLSIILIKFSRGNLKTKISIKLKRLTKRGNRCNGMQIILQA